jgi:hypothetical protein
MRYGNDVVLTELARQIHNTEKSLQAHLTDGKLDGAFLRALEMTNKLDKFKERLNDLKYRKT